MCGDQAQVGLLALQVRMGCMGRMGCMPAWGHMGCMGCMGCMPTWSRMGRMGCMGCTGCTGCTSAWAHGRHRQHGCMGAWWAWTAWAARGAWAHMVYERSGVWPHGCMGKGLHQDYLNANLATHTLAHAVPTCHLRTKPLKQSTLVPLCTHCSSRFRWAADSGCYQSPHANSNPCLNCMVNGPCSKGEWLVLLGKTLGKNIC